MSDGSASSVKDILSDREDDGDGEQEEAERNVSVTEDLAIPVEQLLQLRDIATGLSTESSVIPESSGAIKRPAKVLPVPDDSASIGFSRSASGPSAEVDVVINKKHDYDRVIRFASMHDVHPDDVFYALEMMRVEPQSLFALNNDDKIKVVRLAKEHGILTAATDPSLDSFRAGSGKNKGAGRGNPVPPETSAPPPGRTVPPPTAPVPQPPPTAPVPQPLPLDPSMFYDLTDAQRPAGIGHYNNVGVLEANASAVLANETFLKAQREPQNPYLIGLLTLEETLLIVNTEGMINKFRQFFLDVNKRVLHAKVNYLAKEVEFDGFDPKKLFLQLAAIEPNFSNLAHDMILLITLALCRGTNMTKTLSNLKPEMRSQYDPLRTKYSISDKMGLNVKITLNRIMQAFAPLTVLIATAPGVKPPLEVTAPVPDSLIGEKVTLPKAARTAALLAMLPETLGKDDLTTIIVSVVFYLVQFNQLVDRRPKAKYRNAMKRQYGWASLVKPQFFGMTTGGLMTFCDGIDLTSDETLATFKIIANYARQLTKDNAPIKLPIITVQGYKEAFVLEKSQ